MNDEVLYSIALSEALEEDYRTQNQLMERLGSAKSVYDHHMSIRDVIPDAGDVLVMRLKTMDQYMVIAEAEVKWADKRGVHCICRNDERYPRRLRECADAPILLYTKGEADLNAKHVVSVVGTRHCTEYGKKMCEHLIEDIKVMVPDTLIVSGLAYGIDITAHRAALEKGLPTVAVLAHNIGTIYPSVHKHVAEEMLENGGLVTEYSSGATTSKRNFVARNRIVAGMSDAVVVVESKAWGGSLITAKLANSYNRDVFAFPGSVGKEMSAGCNGLIKKCAAQLIESGEDLVLAMMWEQKTKKDKAVQAELFPEYTPEEREITDVLREREEGMTVNELAAHTSQKVPKLLGTLFGMGMKGIIKELSGQRYRLP